MTSLITPLYKDEQFLGVVGHDVILDDIYEKILDKKYFQTGYSFIFDKKKNVIIHPHHLGRLLQTAKMGTYLSFNEIDSPEAVAAISRIATVQPDIKTTIHEQFSEKGISNHLFASKLDFLDWYFGIVIPHNEVVRTLDQFQSKFTFGAVLLSIALFLIIVVVLWFFVASPIAKLTLATRDIKSGKFGKKLAIKSQDEIGQLSQSFNDMSQELGQTVRRLKEDITARERAETALKESEEKFRNIAENSMVGVNIIQDDRLIYVNPKFADIFGYTVQECLDNMNFRQLVYPEDLQIVQANVSKRLSGQAKSVNYAFRGIKKNGEIIHVEIFGSSIELNGSVAAIGTILDITTRKQLERQLQQSQKLESIGNLAGGIAHDFNNILSSIIGYTELALDDTDKGTPIEDSLQEVYTAAHRATDLVKQILAFARQSDENRKPIMVATVLQEVLKLIRSTIPSNIDIREKIRSRSLVMGNPFQIHQLFMNLFTNAAQSMEETGGILTVGLSDAHPDEILPLQKAGLMSDNYIKIVVSDTGSGIAPDIMDSIFDPYFTTKSVGEGTGMGLALVHGIVDSYGGKISVESQLAKGTAFTIYLPITEKYAPSDKRTEEPLPFGNEHIIVVDDELPIAEIVGRILKKFGYQVSVRTSSIEALELFRAKPNDFDLIITDMTMPNLTGDELSMELIALRNDIPIILCTGYSKKISDRLASKVGIKAFAYKPILKADLLKTIRRVLDDAKNRSDC